MTNIYCGSKKQVPKGKKRGSMKECAQIGEVRYYGIKKIDQRLVDAMEDSKKKVSMAKKKEASQKRSLEEAYITLAGKMKKLKDKIDVEKDKTKKSQLQKEFKELEVKKSDIKKQLDKHKLSRLSRMKSKSHKRKTKSKSKLLKKSKTQSRLKKSKSKTKSKK